MCLCGCGSGVKESELDPLDRLTGMKGYEAEADITYSSERGDTELKVKQYALSDGRYRIDIESPEELKDCSLICDGNMVWHINPHLSDNRISFTPKDKSSRRQLILFSFIENYVKMPSFEPKLSGDELVLESGIQGDYKLLSTERLWLDAKSGIPQRLVIYDSDGKERIKEEFTDFKYKDIISEDRFKPN
jgi:outer membrane lipoprotein-sorting protein